MIRALIIHYEQDEVLRRCRLLSLVGGFQSDSGLTPGTATGGLKLQANQAACIVGQRYLMMLPAGRLALMSQNRAADAI